MIRKISPSQINGSIVAPSSKSSMQRACAVALLSKGESKIINPGFSNDDKAALEIIRSLGAFVKIDDDGSLLIKSEGIKAVKDAVTCGESGLAIRMFTPIIALLDSPIVIKGEGSLEKRPMHLWEEILPKLQVKINSTKGKIPLTIRGPLVPSTIEIDGSLSSQFLTGLLIAYAAASADNVSLLVKDLASKEYIDLTLDVLSKFGVIIENRNYEEFIFKNTNELKACHYTVEADWSNSAFLLVAAAISGKLEIKGLNLNSSQPDRAILKVLKSANANIDISDEQIRVTKSDLSAFEFDATHCPDLFPPLVSLAAACKGVSRIKGTSRLKNKESDRALTLQKEFTKIGVKVELIGDEMIVTGAQEILSNTVSSCNDHRIAMACSVSALSANGAITIEDADAVNKSYPGFFKDLIFLGARVN